MKEDLRKLIKPCMLVQMRDGSMNMVMQTVNGICFVEVDGDSLLKDCRLHMELQSYDEQLNTGFISANDIMIVYGLEKHEHLSMQPSTKRRKIIWKREEC